VPPKPKFSCEDIITAAFEISREAGIEAVVAREVGRRLETSVSPIFSVFSGMDELRREVYLRARKSCIAYLRECVRFTPAFKAFGLRWIRFAEEEPHLFRLLFWSGKLQGRFPESIVEEYPDVMEPLLSEIETGFGLKDEDARRLLQHMLIQANGIATLLLCSEAEFSEEEISRSLSESCMGMVFYLKMKDNCFDPALAGRMIGETDRLPEEKKG